jgi:hypothetical protein
MNAPMNLPIISLNPRSFPMLKRWTGKAVPRFTASTRTASRTPKESDVADKVETKRKRRSKSGKGLTIAGAAVGIGSAALVAALLYAGRAKPAKPAKPTVRPMPEPTD